MRNAERRFQGIGAGEVEVLGDEDEVADVGGKEARNVVDEHRRDDVRVMDLPAADRDLLQEGEDLHTFCSAVHHYGISWMPSSMEQRVGRIDRVNSETERRLTLANGSADGSAKLQVYYPHLRDTDGLARQAAHARSLGFGGKSAIHPSQLPIIHTAFIPGEDELAWARRGVNVFEESGGAAVQLPDGEFVDLPVAERARRILQSQ